MDQKTYNLWDSIIKGVGLLALIISASFAWHQFKEGQEREFKKVFYERRIATITEVFETMLEIDSATNDAERRRAANRFWMIHHSKARTFLDAKMFSALDLPVDYVATCISHTREKPKIIKTCAGFNAAMAVTGFADVARRQLALGWKLDFEEIGEEDPFSAGSNR